MMRRSACCGGGGAAGIRAATVATTALLLTLFWSPLVVVVFGDAAHSSNDSNNNNKADGEIGKRRRAIRDGVSLTKGEEEEDHRRQLRRKAQSPSSCPICSDGSRMSRPSSTIVLPAEEDFGGIVVQPAVTCGDLPSLGRSLSASEDDASECDSLQVAAAAKCGCPVPAASDIACPLCPAANAILPPDVNLEISEFGTTAARSCFDLLLEAAAVSSTLGEQCASLQRLGVLLCGCEPLQVEPTAAPQQENGMDCTENPMEQFPLIEAKKKKEEEEPVLLGCSDLANGFESAVVEWYCNSFRTVRKGCKRTCRGKGKDRSKVEFAQVDLRQTIRTCDWLQQRSTKKASKICRRFEIPRNVCPETCQTCP